MTRSEALYERACRLMPGGVNSPVRAFGAVGGTPPFIDSGTGATITDVDGRTYIDYLGSWGPLILGHAHPRVVEAVTDAAERGLSYGACHEAEIVLAELIRESFPHVEMLRLVNSGTEAAMSAVRLARAATGRESVIKFEGCYHGHADGFLVSAGSGALTFAGGKMGRSPFSPAGAHLILRDVPAAGGRKSCTPEKGLRPYFPSSPGVTRGAAEDTLLAKYNDLSSVEELLDATDGKVACVIVEPVAGNMGVVPPAEGFLAGLRRLCDRSGALLVFDEVITGFRVSPGGAAEVYGVTPDLTVLGKVIGGGMPVGAYGGGADLMREMSPEGPVYQAGTLSGNPIATAAGIATLRVLAEEDTYGILEGLASRLERGVSGNLSEFSLRWAQNRVASMSTLFFGIESAASFDEVRLSDTDLYARYHAAMLERGVYLAPSQFEAVFVSAAHTAGDIDRTLEVQRESLKEALA